MGQQDLNGRDLLAGLTGKQREVLDLLLQHQTSKEIARRLEISPHTVDQRIEFAKRKLGVNSRSEVAVTYRRLLQLSGRLTYEESGIAGVGIGRDDASGAQASLKEPAPWTPIRSGASAEAQADFLVVQGMFDGRYGTLMRLGAIIAIAVLLTLLVLGALATLSQLSVLFAQ